MTLNRPPSTVRVQVRVSGKRSFSMTSDLSRTGDMMIISTPIISTPIINPTPIIIIGTIIINLFPNLFMFAMQKLTSLSKILVISGLSLENVGPDAVTPTNHVFYFYLIIRGLLPSRTANAMLKQPLKLLKREILLIL